MIFSRFISYLFHPVFTPAYGIYLLFLCNKEISNYSYHPDLDIQFQFVLRLFLAAVLVLMITVILKFTDLIDTIEAESKEDRLKLYIITLVCFGFMYYLLRFQQILHPAIMDGYFGFLLALSICTITTFFYKISAHMVGVAAVGGMLYGVGNITFDGDHTCMIGALLAAGLVGTARMFEGSHSLRQIIYGFCLGFFSTYFSITLEWSPY